MTAINQNKALWEKGDFTRIAESMRKSGEALVMTLGITDGLEVLDLGCGDGNTALPAAKLGAHVLGVDIASNLVEAGNERARSLGLANVRFQEGDATDLSELDDDSFDLVVSIFGAMFAPRPFDVAKEMVRVTRPGGRIVMGNWIPNDPTLVAQILKISSAYSPPPPEGFVSPMTWGVEDEVIERFADAGVPAEKISFERDTYTFNFLASRRNSQVCSRSTTARQWARSKLQQPPAVRPNWRASWTPSSTVRTKVRAPTQRRFPPPSCR
jgi:ubiquinone/menaquinone biosynthesis C-methylase UbiE